MTKKNALLCMALNIGGAETHIYELAKELHAQGNDVTVFSNGGVYADALEEAGIKHIKTPLHTKALPALVKSFFILLREFKKNRPSVVHSHTRISNTVGGLVCHRLKIPMVTTVHFNFKTNIFYRLFSNWGCRALSVSEDLKKYLVKNYGYNPDHVEITVNGIDMNRFKKRELPEFRASLGVHPHEKMILLVSRLDKEASIHVSNFLRIAPAIFKEEPNVRVVIVGHGNLFSSFEKKVAEINAACDKDFIQLEGARTNIDEYTAVADLFVGISRSALEAMSSSVPTVLMGNLGYLGFYSDDIIEECIETNLTCRGYPYPDDSEVIKVILDCLKAKDLSANIEQGKNLVKNYYSVRTMAQTACKQYDAAIEHCRPNDFMISGYYGSNNFGDTFMLSLLTEELASYKGSILTRDVKNTAVPKNVTLIHRFNLFKIGKMMKKTKLFILGGGSVLQDSTSNRSFFYYHHILKMAIKNHCKVFLYANGFGPIQKESNLKKARKLLNKAEMITVRDPGSLKFSQELGIKSQIYLTTDEVFSCQDKTFKPTPLPKEASQKTIVGINLKCAVKEPEKVNDIAKALKELAEEFNLYYFLLPLHLTQDTAFLESIHKQIPEYSCMAKATSDPIEICSNIAACDYQIVERYHGQVMSAILGLPYVPIEYDPKNSSLTKMIGLTDYALPKTNFSGETLITAFKKIMDEQEIIKDKMSAFCAEAKKNAQKNHELLHQTIEEY